MTKLIYFDMDGVLADWVSGFEALFPTTDYATYNELSEDEQTEYRQTIDGNGYFYLELKPFKLVIEAMAALKARGYKVEILSSVGRYFPELVIEQKREWLARHIPFDIVANFVNKSEHKARYATSDRLLLDDRRKSVQPFVEAGGKGYIFHGCSVTSVDDVLELVENLFEDCPMPCSAS